MCVRKEDRIALLVVAIGVSVCFALTLLVLVGARFVVALLLVRGSPGGPALGSGLLLFGVARGLALESGQLAGDGVCWTKVSIFFSE